MFHFSAQELAKWCKFISVITNVCSIIAYQLHSTTYWFYDINLQPVLVLDTLFNFLSEQSTPQEQYFSLFNS